MQTIILHDEAGKKYELDVSYLREVRNYKTIRVFKCIRERKGFTVGKIYYGSLFEARRDHVLNGTSRNYMWPHDAIALNGNGGRHAHIECWDTFFKIVEVPLLVKCIKAMPGFTVGNFYTASNAFINRPPFADDLADGWLPLGNDEQRHRHVSPVKNNFEVIFVS